MIFLECLSATAAKVSITTNSQLAHRKPNWRTTAYVCWHSFHLRKLFRTTGSSASDSAKTNARCRFHCSSWQLKWNLDRSIGPFVIKSSRFSSIAVIAVRISSGSTVACTPTATIFSRWRSRRYDEESSQNFRRNFRWHVGFSKEEETTALRFNSLTTKHWLH